MIQEMVIAFFTEACYNISAKTKSYVLLCLALEGLVIFRFWRREKIKRGWMFCDSEKSSGL